MPSLEINGLLRLAAFSWLKKSHWAYPPPASAPNQFASTPPPPKLLMRWHPRPTSHPGPLSTGRSQQGIAGGAGGTFGGAGGGGTVGGDGGDGGDGIEGGGAGGNSIRIE